MAQDAPGRIRGARAWPEAQRPHSGQLHGRPIMYFRYLWATVFACYCGHEQVEIMKSRLQVLKLVLKEIHALIELILNRSHAILQFVVCVGLLSFAVYTISTPGHAPAAVDFAFTVVGTMLGKVFGKPFSRGME